VGKVNHHSVFYGAEGIVEIFGRLSILKLGPGFVNWLFKVWAYYCGSFGFQTLKGAELRKV